MDSSTCGLSRESSDTPKALNVDRESVLEKECDVVLMTSVSRWYRVWFMYNRDN